MLFTVVCLDSPGAGDRAVGLRAATLPAHRDYINGFTESLLLSGPLLDDDGTGRVGQLYVIDLPDRASAQSFVDDDPFTQAGLFESVLIRRITPVIQNGKRIIQDGKSMGQAAKPAAGR